MSVRDRIWSTLDDPGLGDHTSLRNALYQLLVATEFGGPPGPSSIERCLDLAAAAIRDGSGAAVTRASNMIDAVVASLARAAAATESPERACGAGTATP